MMRRNFLQVLLVLLLAYQTPAFAADGAASRGGIWSKEATSLLLPAQTRRIEIPAPDNRKLTIVEGLSLHVAVSGKRLPGTERETVGTLAELLWAPDSTAFFITESEGGSIGRWDVDVYLVTGKRVRRVNVTRNVVHEFKKHYKCVEPEEPNVGAVQWMGSEMLMLAAEVPPHSSCPEMGKIRGYIVSVPKGKILQELSKEELTGRWGSYLGSRLRE